MHVHDTCNLNLFDLSLNRLLIVDKRKLRYFFKQSEILEIVIQKELFYDETEWTYTKRIRALAQRWRAQLWFDFVC